MKQILNYLIVLSFILLFYSCSKPKTKEAYLEKFEYFVQRVEQNYKNYNKKDWQWADSKFKKFNDEWYPKFSEDFSLTEQVKAKTLIVRYRSYKKRETVDEQIQKLQNNNLDEGLEALKEGVKAIGDSAIKVLEDVIKEIEK